jgi:hypothetical protein
MNSTVLKFGAVVLFAGGIIGFVAYRAGFFDEEVNVDSKDKKEQVENKSKDNAINMDPADSNKPAEPQQNSQKNPQIIQSDDIEPVIMPSSKSSLVFSPEDFEIEHMPSSKSAPIFTPSDLSSDSIKKK